MPAIWERQPFRGNPYHTITAIDSSGGIVLSASSGDGPTCIQASASAITATGTSKPYEHLEFSWTIEQDDGGAGWEAITDFNGFLNPATDAAFNPYTDEEGGECPMYLSPGLFSGRNYRITLGIRGYNGGGHITDSITEEVAVSAWSGDHLWVDQTNGDAGNDGLDPWGFDTSGCTYNNTTGVLTRPLATPFDPYDHSAATAASDPSLHYNMISVTSAADPTFDGQHEILGKIGGSQLQLEAGLASGNLTDVVCGTGPKADFSSNPASNRWYHFRAGGAYTGFPGPENRTNIIASRYGTGADPTWSQQMFFNCNNASAGCDLLRLIGIHILVSGTNSPIFVFADQDGVNDFYLIDCVVECGDSGTGRTPINFNNTGHLSDRFGMWGGSLLNVAGDSNGKIGFLGGPDDWCFFQCTFIEGGGVGAADLDHHTYTEVATHLHYRVDHGTGAGRNFCANFNRNRVAGSGLEYAEFYNIQGCDFTGTKRAFDFGNGSNNPATSRFRNIIIDGCSLHGMTGDALILPECIESWDFRDSVFWANTTDRLIHIPATSDDIFTGETHHLLIHSAAGISGSTALILFGTAFTTAWRVSDCDIVDLRTAANALQFNWSQTGSPTTSGNRIWCPDDTDDDCVFNDSTGQTVAEYIASEDATGLEEDPNWVDGPNGNFTEGGAEIIVTPSTLALTLTTFAPTVTVTGGGDDDDRPGWLLLYT